MNKPVLVRMVALPGFAVAAYLALSAFVSPVRASQVQAARGPAAGLVIYQNNRTACHGTEAKGVLKLGDPTAADICWQAIGLVYHNDPALVARAITAGQNQGGQAPDDVMPRW